MFSVHIPCVMMLLLLVQLPCSNTGFGEVPSPPLMIVTQKERHTYRCNHTQTNQISWWVNGSQLNIEIFPLNIRTAIVPLSNGSRVYTLTIGGLPEHNATTIQCRANDADGSIHEATTIIVKFLIQGSLQSITNLVRRNSTLSWDAPFSFDLTAIDPDIVYCVEVYNITCGRSLLISECDVMETSYTNDALLPGYIFEYTITPRSNVKGVMNGTSLVTREQFQVQIVPQNGYILGIINGSTVNTTLKIHLDNDDTAGLTWIIADSYFLLLNPLYGRSDTTYQRIVVPAFDMRDGGSIILQAHLSLPFRNLWTCTVLAYGCDEHPIMETAQLSTYDIQNISVASTFTGEIRVTCDFIDGSTASGVLSIVYSLVNNSLVYYSFAPLSAEKRIEDIIPGLPSSHYGVSVFVVVESGLPFPQVAATPVDVSVRVLHKTITSDQSPIKYDVHPTSTGVCITCTFLDSSTTDCVAVVHQQISQLSSNGLINIESSHRFNRSDDTAYGCIEGVNLTLFQIGVIKPRKSVASGSSMICKGCIFGTGTAVLLVSVLIAVLILSAAAIIKKKRNTTDKQAAKNTIKLQTCGAYEIVKLSSHRAIMKENIAYAVVGESVSS